MDLGLGGFLEKFEDHFGRGLTKALLILIGLAVAALCGSVIWTYVLYPIAALIPDPNPRSGPWYEFGKLVVVLALFLMIVNQLLQLVDNYTRRKLRAQLREKVAEARQVWLEAEETMGRADALVKRTEDNLAAAILALEQVYTHALEHHMLTQEQVAELRSLKD